MLPAWRRPENVAESDLTGGTWSRLMTTFNGVEKGATALLMPVACRRQLVDLSDDMATRIDIQFYSDAKDALLKAMAE